MNWYTSFSWYWNGNVALYGICSLPSNDENINQTNTVLSYFLFKKAYNNNLLKSWSFHCVIKRMKKEISKPVNTFLRSWAACSCNRNLSHNVSSWYEIIAWMNVFQNWCIKKLLKREHIGCIGEFEGRQKLLLV